MANTLKSQNLSVPQEELMRYGATFGGIAKIIVGYDDGRSYTSRPSDSFPGGVGIPEKYDPRTRSWYKQAKQTNGLSFSKLFFTKSNQTPMIGVMYSLGNSVVLADIRFDKLGEQLSGLEQIYQAKGIVVDENGMVVASNFDAIHSQDQISSLPQEYNIPNIIEHIGELFPSEVGGQPILLMAKEIRISSGKKWSMVSFIDPKIAYSEMDELIVSEVLKIICTIIVSIIIMLLVMNYLYQPIKSLRTIVDELSNGEGDLTQRLVVKSDDDLGKIADGINKFIEQIQFLMLKIESASTSLKENVQQLEVQADETSYILTQHSKETEQIVTAIEELNSTAETVAQNAETTANSTNSASEYGKLSKTAVCSTQEQVSQLATEVENTAASLQNMSNESKEISNILTVIGEIADQTNLLALNAAIEAARAGEQGRGFSVVADEVRTLASRTQDSTEEINQTLKRLLSINDEVVRAMENTKTKGFESTNNIVSVGASLDNLTEQVSCINDLMAEIATVAEQQSGVTQEISLNMNALSSLVGALSQNVEKTMNQAGYISQINSNLVLVVNQFKLR
ncbi:methyl-accepting chemotaxis protein [Vibrio sp. AK197]